jgi:hypothetical protein
MDSTAIVEQVVRKGWAGADASTLEELVSPGRVTELLSLFHRAFTDVGLNEFGPIFSNADGTMVAFFGEMHLRQVADFLHVSAVGRQADVGFTGIFRVDAGKVPRCGRRWISRRCMSAEHSVSAWRGGRAGEAEGVRRGCGLAATGQAQLGEDV